MTPATIQLIMFLTNTALTLLKDVGPARAALTSRIENIKLMIQEGRDPTAEEVAELDSSLSDLRSESHS